MNTNPRSICPVCGPVVITTRGEVPAGSLGRWCTNTLGPSVQTFITCHACNGTGVFVPTTR